MAYLDTTSLFHNAPDPRSCDVTQLRSQGHRLCRGHRRRLGRGRRAVDARRRPEWRFSPPRPEIRTGQRAASSKVGLRTAAGGQGCGWAELGRPARSHGARSGWPVQLGTARHGAARRDPDRSPSTAASRPGQRGPRHLARTVPGNLPWT